MTVELVSMGTELLMGSIVNNNTQFLAEKCVMSGLNMYYQVTVGDNCGRIKEVVKTAPGRPDTIILTGELGPTEDDLTEEVCADVMGMELVEDLHVRKHLEASFEHNICKEIPDNNWKMTTVSSGALVLDNGNGMAPELILEKDGKTVILLPGLPGELYPMFEQRVFPWLSGCQQSVLVSRMVEICGCGENQVEEGIPDLIGSQTNLTIATYAKTAEVHLRITARGATEEEVGRLIEPVLGEIKDRFKEKIYTTDEHVNLEIAVVELLEKHRPTAPTAEPYTGGMVTVKLVNASGVSQASMQEMVIYSNEAKMGLLGVKEDTLRTHGAVSEETAKEMASGGAAASGTDVCVTITGLAGPEGDTSRRPVGLAYMACCIQGNVVAREYHFKGNRDKIWEQSMMKALDLVRLRTLNHEASR